MREKPLVLVIDDTVENLSYVSNLLELNNYETAVSTSAKEALESLRYDLPDLILLDIMMPKMNGYEFCEILKKNSYTKNIPIIFLTAKTNIDDIVKAFDVGGVDYITKPFNSKELLARVNTHIELKRSRDEIKTLRGILPVCAGCKNIRDGDQWVTMEQYISQHSEAEFSHSLCPDCVKKFYPDLVDDDGQIK